MKLNYSYIILICCFFILGCKSTRKQSTILYFSVHDESERSEKVKKLISKQGWHFKVTADPSSLWDDSLNSISAIVMHISDINNLDHRAIPQLKRYLEAGGGGIIAINDTLLEDKGWPWLQSWLEKDEGAMFDQDQGRLALLSSSFSSGDLAPALKFAIGDNYIPQYKKTTTLSVPDSSRYIQEVLVQGLDEPMQMAILPNMDVLFVERKGGVKLFDHESGETKTVANLNVFSGIEDGLLGVALDPGFEENHWVYFYYAAAGEIAINKLSRFELYNDSLVLGSEKILLEIPTQRIYCCHSAGYLSFDSDGLLYISIGDNTNAEETEGYTPVDERPGRSLADDQATAANTNDFRGKILRIRPLPDGTYSIPEGNLFPQDGSVGKPEIYIMGSRNPYRFSIDWKNNYLYWGDVGPDTKVKASTGELMSFDEINQAREAGFYGWPYFLGNNEIFPMYNYATKVEEEGKNPLTPMNLSPNNTGAKELPPAKSAMIWYGKGNSEKFPLVGNGGATAMAGPVFYSEAYADPSYGLSKYYDGKLFIYEWIRGWVMAVTFDENGNYLRMEPFLEHLTFDAPIDMQFGPDGSLYMLEYGTNWFSKNSNAKLVRIQYVEGNRAPNGVIDVDKEYGASPMEVKISAKNSFDHDRTDNLSYTWEIENNILEGEDIAYTFTKDGTYEIALSVKDNNGGIGTTTKKVFVGNTPPQVNVNSKANQSFYWDNSFLDYDIQVSDNEEEVNLDRINLSFGYIPLGKDAATILTGNQDVSDFNHLKGKQLIASLDCRSCHSIDMESVGPTYQKIAERYSNKAGSLKLLAEKIINGGSGAWGERAMSPHPTISEKEAEEMVGYILSLTDRQLRIPIKDSIKLSEHIGKGNEGAYLLRASYKDQGANGIGELQSHDYILLKSPIIQAEDFDEGNVGISTITTAFLAYITHIQNGKYIKFNQIDLSHVKSLIYNVQLNGSGGDIEVRLDKPDGALISTITIPAGKTDLPTSGWKEMGSEIRSTAGKHDLYFVFKSDRQGYNFFNIDWIKFSNR